MNNIHVITTNLERIPSIPGVIYGFECTGNQYYVIIEGALYKIGNAAPVMVPLCPDPLLKTIAYDAPGKKVFVSDGKNFYYDIIEQRDCQRVPCPKQVLACAYSPMGDKLVYLDIERNIVLCDIYPELGNIVEEAKWSLDDDAPAQINVNWGAKSTQFAGFDNTTRVDRVRNAVGADCEDDTPEIVWRPDGKFFLISHTTDKIRSFKIFCITRGAISNGENIPGMLTPIAWQSLEFMIAAACHSDDLWKIVIYEPNGCAKLAFTMFNNVPITQLTWSKDGSVLAILEKGPVYSNVLLLTIRGYRFELKQNLVFSSPVRYVKWMESNNNIQHLAVILKDVIVHYYLRLGPSSSFLSVDEGASIGIINGYEFVLVNTEKNITPPPLWENIQGSKITFSSSISQVIFNSISPMFLCIDCKNYVHIYSYRGNVISRVSEDGGFPLPAPNKYPLHIHHFGFFDHYIVIYLNDDNEKREIIFDLKNRTLQKMCYWRADITGIKVVKTYGGLKKYTFYSNGDLCLDTLLIRNYTNIIIKMESFCHQGKHYLLVLDNANRFFCDEVLVADNVTSFITFHEYVLFTANNTLYGSRQNIFIQIIHKNTPLQFYDSRTITNGGILIAPIPSKLNTLIQDTTGVMEILSTGLLGVDYVNILLNKGLWDEVHAEIKLRHLNMNLIVDTNMSRFLSNAHQFLEESQKQYLQDFFLQLNGDNVLSTMTCKYQFYNLTPIPNKIERVCSLIVDIMKVKDVEKYFGIILLALVKWEGLPEAIKYAQQIYSQGTTELNKVVENGLMLIGSFWSADDILTECLKTYDLDFAVFAHFIHKRDPAATATLLDAFYDSKSESEMRYKVNDQVGDYKQAIKYFVLHILDRIKCDDPQTACYDEVIDYAMAHNELGILYDFLQIYSVSVPRLCLELALHHELHNRKQRAAELYFEAGDLEASYTIYASMFNWMEAIQILDAMKLDEKTRRIKLMNFAYHLSAAGHHNGAKHIHLMIEEYCEAINEAILEHSYIEARYLIEQHAPDMLMVLLSDILNYISTLQDLFEQTTVDLQYYADRLDEIRSRRQRGDDMNVKDAQPRPILASSDGEANVNLDASQEGAESVRTTFSSVGTQNTTSSKKSKKEQKKFTNMKFGGLYEDIAIMRTAHMKITEICKLKKDLDNISETLGITGDQHRCSSLIRNFHAMLDLFEGIISRIWINNLNDPDIVNDELLAARRNIIYLEYQYRVRPEITKLITDAQQ